MIDVKDLMIGDWVCTEHDSTPRQIDWIRTGEVGLLWNKVVTPPYLVPIPLTAEILEKNGFKIVHGFGYSESYPTYGWGYHKGLRNFTSVDVTFYDEPIGSVLRLVKMETASKKDDGINSIHSCDIEFIHELQHCLKLAGIEKDIVL